MIQNLRQLNLNLLLVFDALMEEQNLSRAAERLYMSQPAASNALAKLRAQLDDPLFKRTSHGMQPTARARLIHEPVRQALQLLKLGLSPTDNFDNSAEHLFRLAMNDYAQERLLPQLMALMEQELPLGIIAVQDDDADSLSKRLAAGDLDLAVDYLHLNDHNLRYQTITEEELVAIGRHGHPAFEEGLTLDDYHQCQHVSLLTRSNRGSPLEIVLGAAKIRRKVSVYVPNFLTMTPIVAKTDLIAAIPRRQAEKAQLFYPIQIAPMPIAIPPIPVSLIWHKQQDSSASLLWLRQRIVALMTNDAPPSSTTQKPLVNQGNHH